MSYLMNNEVASKLDNMIDALNPVSIGNSQK